MRKLFPFMKDINEFEETLYLETLKSEKIRIVFMSFLFLVIGIGSFVLKNFLSRGPDGIDPMIGRQFPAYKIFFIIFFGLLYELLILFLLNKVISQKIRIPDAPRYGNLIVETTLVAAIVYFFAREVDPIVSFNSPIYNIFFYLIILSALRLSFLMSLVSGLVAGIEFLSITLYLLPPGHSSGFDSFFHAPPQYIAKSLMLVVGGALAGYVANKVKDSLRTSLKALNERNKITGMFGQYVSPAVVEKLLSQSTDFTGEVKFVTMVFLDIRDFTKYSEKKTPEEVVLYLNKLFTHLIEIINRNNGIINKFLGDGFMAVFGAPISDAKDAHNAVKAGFEIIEKVGQLNQNGEIDSTKIGIGMHCGPAVTGNIGSAERKEYTIIGDTVNLASRVEQLNKEYHSSFLITKDVYDKVNDIYQGEELAPVKVKGRDDKVVIYKLS